MKRTNEGAAWRREGDHILVVADIDETEVRLSMEDLREMAIELARHLDTLPLD